MNKISGFAVIAISVLLSVTFSQVLLNKALGEGIGVKGISGAGMIWRLDLTKEQKEKIIAKESAVRKETLPLMQSIRGLKSELNAELSAENPDNSKVSAMIDKISKDMTDIQKKEVFFMLWMREQLTPEQKQKLLLLLKDRQQTRVGSQDAGANDK
ncbi:MAG: periplasmic heavy metal sensor [Candidatus Margulisiibacteriota bacterium]